MLVLGFIVTNLIIFGAWFSVVASRRSSNLTDLPAFSGLLMGAQIVFSQIVLGNLGLLTVYSVVAVNLVFSFSLIALVWRMHGTLLTSRLLTEIRTLRWLELLGPINLVILLLAVFLSFWICLATYLLPPRGVDDLVYHLPPLYEYVQNHKIALLPLDLRDQFAMPLGGEFLFLWTVVFLQSDMIVDGVQFAVGIYGVFVLYALARCLDIGRRDAAFVSALFLFTPVVLGQAGCSYVDLIVAACHLVLVYACVRFWQTGSTWNLAMAGVAAGFGIGVKYNMLPAILAVQPIVWLGLRRWSSSPLRGYGAFLICAIPLGLFWILRNFLETGMPFYPYELEFDRLRPPLEPEIVLNEIRPRGLALRRFILFPGKFFRYPFEDPGLGSLHGGFGGIVWALGIPALVYVSYRAAKSAFNRNFFAVCFWGQAWITFLVFFSQVHYARLIYNQRYIIVVAGFALLAFGAVLPKLRAELPHAVVFLKSFCVFASILAVMHMASYSLPDYQIKPAIMDRVDGTRTSDYKYYRTPTVGLSNLSTSWAPLDFLTRSGPGWDVYFAARWDLFSTAPLFGSRIQNRVWNFLAEPPSDPDAFIFFPGGPTEQPFYVGRRITPDQVMIDGRYELVTVGALTEFWAKTELLSQTDTRKKQIEYYFRTFGDYIRILQPLIADIPNDANIITSLPPGHALKYFSLTGALPNPVQLVPRGQERTEAVRSGSRRVITIGSPVSGFRSEPLFLLSAPEGSVMFFDNLRR